MLSYPATSCSPWSQSHPAVNALGGLELTAPPAPQVDVLLRTQPFLLHGDAITGLLCTGGYTEATCWEAWDLKLTRLGMATLRRYHGLKYAPSFPHTQKYVQVLTPGT